MTLSLEEEEQLQQETITEISLASLFSKARTKELKPGVIYQQKDKQDFSLVGYTPDLFSSWFLRREILSLVRKVFFYVKDLPRLGGVQPYRQPHKSNDRIRYLFKILEEEVHNSLVSNSHLLSDKAESNPYDYISFELFYTNVTSVYVVQSPSVFQVAQKRKETILSTGLPEVLRRATHAMFHTMLKEMLQVTDFKQRFSELKKTSSITETEETLSAIFLEELEHSRIYQVLLPCRSPEFILLLSSDIQKLGLQPVTQKPA